MDTKIGVKPVMWANTMLALRATDVEPQVLKPHFFSAMSVLGFEKASSFEVVKKGPGCKLVPTSAKSLDGKIVIAIQKACGSIRRTDDWRRQKLIGVFCKYAQ